jgi:hypothetical protein
MWGDLSIAERDATRVDNADTIYSYNTNDHCEDHQRVLPFPLQNLTSPCMVAMRRYESRFQNTLPIRHSMIAAENDFYFIEVVL